MTITAVLNEKGGTGKTTTAVNLAALRALNGYDVVIVDTDQRGSASFWVGVRDEAEIEPRVACVQKFGRGLAAEIQDMSRRYGDIVIDAGGRGSDVEMQGALNIAQVAIIPMQPSQFDSWALARMSSLVEQARIINPTLDARVLITRASTNPSVRDEEAALELLNDYPDLKPCTTIIRERSSYRRSTGFGLSVMESTPADLKARAEIEALYQEVYSNGI